MEEALDPSFDRLLMMMMMMMMIYITMLFCQEVIVTNVKGKAVPLQAWTGPESTRRLRFPDFKTIGT